VLQKDEGGRGGWLPRNASGGGGPGRPGGRKRTPSKALTRSGSCDSQLTRTEKAGGQHDTCIGFPALTEAMKAGSGPEGGWVSKALRF